MKPNLRWTFALVVLLSLCVSGWAAFGQRQIYYPKYVWEYRIISDGAEESINALGAEGWELVSVACDTGRCVQYFKRPKLVPFGSR